MSCSTQYGSGLLRDMTALLPVNDSLLRGNLGTIDVGLMKDSD